MASDNYKTSANKLSNFLDKPCHDFTKQDIVQYVEQNDIKAVNLRHVGGDGKLKTLNFVVDSKSHLDKILSAGERVDGSSIFSYIDTSSSDLYIIPRYKTAFVNPFSKDIPTLDILCTYFNKNGERLDISSENILFRAQNSLESSTGSRLHAMGELEYYIIAPKQSLYRATVQRGYQESSPFCKWEFLRAEAMQAISECGGKIKYGHSEVGHIYGEENEMEQNEIEFLPVDVEDAADQVAIAKWIIRMTGYKYGVNITFAPKIMVGHAGSGLHVHTKLVKNGKNMFINNNGLSDNAMKTIAGYLSCAPSLTAFGNTIPLSFLRLVPHQEAPTNICWGDRNRSVLVRVPLGWQDVGNMAGEANPQDTGVSIDNRESQTVEFRCPDGSANIYLLMAGLTVAARHGMEMENALELAKSLYVDINIFSHEYEDVQKQLPQLPTSCWESAEKLLLDRDIYEKDNVFPTAVIDATAKNLMGYNDQDLSQRFYGKGDEIQKLVDEFMHW
ncbi:MAG TPA: glutamine synthetase [Dehalococcoidia bacterium]|nr:glutamine synthetase [Dehalococcoidia bacterium]